MIVLALIIKYLMFKYVVFKLNKIDCNNKMNLIIKCI